MAQKFLTNVELDAGLVDGSNSTGTSGYLLSSTGTATSWVDPAAVSVGESEQVHIACKNTSGVAISKGDPVYITGTVGTSFIIQIAAADASNSAKMPAVGLAETDLAINAEGFVIVSGVLKNLTTDPLSTGDGTPSSNDTVYVKAGGGLTRTKPTGSGNLIQNVGKVGRVNSANAGSLAVSTIMRTNDVPNLTTGKIWVGSSTYTTESGVVHLDESNGRMGIGTTSPTSKLHVAQDQNNTFSTAIAWTASANDVLNITNNNSTDTNNYASLYMRADGSSGSFSSRIAARNTTAGTGELHFQLRDSAHTANTETKLMIDSGGNVGIGTTSPTQKLHIDGTTSNTTGLVHTTTGLAIFRVATDNSDFALLGQGGSNRFDIYDNNAASTRFSINSSGNVGIGTTSPSQKLHVNGTTLVSSALYIGSTSASIYSYFNSLIIQNTASTSVNIGGGPGSVANDLYVSNGSIGIGTTSPSEKLHVYNGTAYVTPIAYAANQSAYALKVGAYNNTAFDMGLQTKSTSGGSPYMSFRTPTVDDTLTIWGGSVGVGGIGIPSYTLDVNGVIRGEQYLRLADTGGTNRFSIRAESTYATLDNGTNTLNTIANAHIFYRGGSEIMRIHSNSNVGIGTTSPAEKLDVSGNVQFDNGDFNILNSSSGNFGGRSIARFRQGADFIQFGDVEDYNTSASLDIDYLNQIANFRRMDLGVNTASPGAALDVAGGIRMANDTNTASASNAGTLRYYVSGSASYVDMCMQIGASTYDWVNIVKNTW